MSQVSSGTFIPTNPDWFPSVLDPTLELVFFQLRTCLQTAQLAEVRGLSRILSSGIATRSIKPCLTSRGTSDLTKAFFHSFATLFRQPLSGTSLVYLKFSTRGIQHQVYLPDIQHPSKETSEHKGALFFFQKKKKLGEAGTDLGCALVRLICTGTS